MFPYTPIIENLKIPNRIERIKPSDEEIDKLFHIFTNSLPKFMLQLKYDEDHQKAKFVPIVNDIFNIGYFAISEKMTTDVKYQTEQKKIHFNEYYAKCIYCRNLFKKKVKIIRST